MTTTVCPQLFIILDREFELSELHDIVDHGMSHGVSGFIYSSDLYEVFEKHECTITTYLDNYCEDTFNQSMWCYIAEQLSFDDQLWTKQELIEHAVWMYVELRAHALLSAHDDNY